MAAVLAGGDGAVLSHRSALALWDLAPTPGGAIDVTGRRGTSGKRPGIRLHHTRHLPDTHTTDIDGIPVTTVARTLLDAAGTHSPRSLRNSLEAAQRRDLLDLPTLSDLLDTSAGGRRGTAHLRAALAELDDEPAWTQSRLEEDFLALVRSAALPLPRVNMLLLDGILVDFCWPAHHLVVEVDGWQHHRTRRSFEEDRRRDLRLQLAGWRVIRLTARRLTAEPEAVVHELRLLLSATGTP